MGKALAALRRATARSMITAGYLARHHMGRGGMAGPALLDVAQDYALQCLSAEGIFDLGVVLKGGTSLRKFRAGNAGRFSTDLDFAAPDVDLGEMLLDTLDGAEIHGVVFHLTNSASILPPATSSTCTTGPMFIVTGALLRMSAASSVLPDSPECVSVAHSRAK